jgi:hypothetical protein
MNNKEGESPDRGGSPFFNMVTLKGEEHCNEMLEIKAQIEEAIYINIGHESIEVLKVADKRKIEVFERWFEHVLYLNINSNYI